MINGGGAPSVRTAAPGTGSIPCGAGGAGGGAGQGRGGWGVLTNGQVTQLWVFVPILLLSREENSAEAGSSNVCYCFDD